MAKVEKRRRGRKDIKNRRRGRENYHDDLKLFGAILQLTGDPPVGLTAAVRAVVRRVELGGASEESKVRRVRRKYIQWTKELAQLGPIVLAEPDDRQNYDSESGIFGPEHRFWPPY